MLKTIERPHLTVKKLSDTKWIVNDYEDEPLNKYQLLKFLVHAVDVSVEDVAFMLLDIRENPSYTKSHFGIFGTYLYSE